MDRDTDRKRGGAHGPPHGEHTRRRDPRADEVSVRLTRKYAEMIDGVSLENASVGDRLDLPPRDADVLIAEGWAVPAEDEPPVRRLPRRATASDRSHRPRKKK